MARLASDWRYWEAGCRPVDYKAGDEINDPQVVAYAEACGVIEVEAKEAPKTTAKKKATE